MKPNWLPTGETLMFFVYSMSIGGAILANQYRLALFIFVVGVMHALWAIVENTKK